MYRGLYFPTPFGHHAQRSSTKQRRKFARLEREVTYFEYFDQTMPRFSRENTIKEKRRMRNNRNKRKRLLRAEKLREAKEIIRQKEQAVHSRAKQLARYYYGKWKELAEQNKRRTLEKSKVSLL